jgi:hypothetical protein
LISAHGGKRSSDEEDAPVGQPEPLRLPPVEDRCDIVRREVVSGRSWLT